MSPINSFLWLVAEEEVRFRASLAKQRSLLSHASSSDLQNWDANKWVMVKAAIFAAVGYAAIENTQLQVLKYLTRNSDKDKTGKLLQLNNTKTSNLIET